MIDTIFLWEARMEEQIGGKYRMELSQTQFSLSTDSIVLADFARVFSGARV